MTEGRRRFQARANPPCAIPVGPVDLLHPVNEGWTAMGREIKRVPLDFDWPLKQVWHGFLNPLYAAEPCSVCDGDGSSPEARRLKNQWYGYEPFSPEDRDSTPFTPDTFVVRSLAERNVKRSPEYYGSGAWAVEREARRLCEHFNSSWSYHLNQGDVDALVEAGRLYDFTHEWRPGEGWTPRFLAVNPTPQEVNEWSLSGLGHDSINQWIVVEAECKRLGVPAFCAACAGQGDVWPSKDAEAAYEAWERAEPPAGEGWQLWETVSEGSPISPVFATSEELVWHLVINEGHSESSARAFVASGWAPSGISTPDGGFVSGIEGMGLLAREDGE